MLESIQRHSSAQHHWQAVTQQAAFRRLLDAVSYPGRVCELDSETADALPLLLATLMDRSVTLSDPYRLITTDDLCRLGAIRATPQQAQFIVMPGDRTPDFEPALGSLENPQLGASLILCAAAFNRGTALRLSGPGIATETVLSTTGIDPVWWSLRRQWNISFPLGVDMLLVAGRQVVSIPRTTQIIMKGTP